MTVQLKHLFSISLISILLIQFGCRGNSSPVKFPDDKINQLDSFVNAIPKRLPVPLIALAVIKDDQVYCKTSGELPKDSLGSKPNSVLFFTGNISELMIATAIMKMVELEKVKLDDPVYQHLPTFSLGDEAFKKITIKHLLMQTSGVPHHSATWDMPYFGAGALDNTTASVRLQQSSFPAGSRLKRNPYNYDILANLIEKVSGIPFEEYMQQNIFKKLGMHSSTYQEKEIRAARLAQPHHIDNWLTYKLKKNDEYPLNRQHAGSIGFHSTIEDLSVWMYMLLHSGNTGNERFLKSSSVDELLKGQIKTQMNNYAGFGSDILNYGDYTVLHKAHDIGGFSADLKLIPKKNAGVIMISNGGKEFNPEVITETLRSWLEGLPLLSIKTPISIPMGRTLASSNSLDSAFLVYKRLKKEQPLVYDFGEEALSQLGVNLFYRLERRKEAIRVYEFCATQYNSSYANLNLAEAFLIEQDTLKARKFLAKALHLPIDKPEIKARLTYIKDLIGSEVNLGNRNQLH